MKTKAKSDDELTLGEWMRTISQLLQHINKRLDSMEEQLYPDPAKTWFNRILEQQQPGVGKKRFWKPEDPES